MITGKSIDKAIKSLAQVLEEHKHRYKTDVYYKKEIDKRHEQEENERELINNIRQIFFIIELFEENELVSKNFLRECDNVYCRKNWEKFLELYKTSFIAKLEEAKGEYLDITQNTIIIGAYGVGKTFSVLRSVVKSLREENLQDFTYVTSLQIFENIYGNEYRLEKYRRTPLLIIDEFTKEYSRKDYNNILYSILDRRITLGIPTILITNYKWELISNTPVKNQERIKNGLKEAPIIFDEDLIDRLKQFKRLTIKGKSKRQDAGEEICLTKY